MLDEAKDIEKGNMWMSVTAVVDELGVAEAADVINGGWEQRRSEGGRRAEIMEGIITDCLCMVVAVPVAAARRQGRMAAMKALR